MAPHVPSHNQAQIWRLWTPLVTDELVWVWEIRSWSWRLQKITHHLRGIYRIFFTLTQQKPKHHNMLCCRLDLETLGSQPIMMRLWPQLKVLQLWFCLETRSCFKLFRSCPKSQQWGMDQIKCLVIVMHPNIFKLHFQYGTLETWNQVHSFCRCDHFAGRGRPGVLEVWCKPELKITLHDEIWRNTGFRPHSTIIHPRGQY